MVVFDELPLPLSLRRGLISCLGLFRLALVGGAVRDLLCHRLHRDPWLGVLDLDLVVQDLRPTALDGGSPAACRLAATLLDQAERNGWRVGFCHVHEAFGTVELEIDEVLFDLATARREVYAAPGQNPSVSFGTLEEDLARRDFSINAMALEFHPSGERLCLLNTHGGLTDLKQRQLQLLHHRSLEDDPTRIVRAARYAARLGFALAADSLGQFEVTIARWPWADGRGSLSVPTLRAVPPALGTRLRKELELMLEREPWPRALSLLQQWGGMVLIDHSLQMDTGWLRRLRWTDRFGLSKLTALLAGAVDPEIPAGRLQLNHREQQLLAQLGRLRRAWQERGEAKRLGRQVCSAVWNPLDWCLFLEQPGWSSDAVALALICGALPRRPLLRWWFRWRHIRSPVRAADLIAQGMHPGPELGEALRRLRAERLAAEDV
ncbi:CCA tRNA nucleotidyltransferase [Cyanobium sp. Cruz-8D1]|nr:CCA tRNA nucleotidyltransferase [Cyanobium sp. Cruz-8H5]MCP9867580.1 CCA tRNA nucleotidyltransferase [Cyanobium sp. Cruz-8D1]